MLNFLFWNINGKPLASAIGKLVRQHQVDVLILAECRIADTELIRDLNTETDDRYQLVERDPFCERLTLVTRMPVRSIRRGNSLSHWSLRRIVRPGQDELILGAFHLPSKLHRSRESQSQGIPAISSAIRNLERRLGHQRTVLVGDFNMNPFETGMVSAEGLNAVMTRDQAARKARTVDGTPHPFFYNPMWSHFGDSNHARLPPGDPTHEPAGTCFFRAKESEWYYWYMFDQVLIRPDLLNSFRNESLRILTHAGDNRLVDKRGRPDRKSFSDHLPLLFSLES